MISQQQQSIAAYIQIYQLTFSLVQKQWVISSLKVIQGIRSQVTNTPIWWEMQRETQREEKASAHEANLQLCHNAAALEADVCQISRVPTQSKPTFPPLVPPIWRHTRSIQSTEGWRLRERGKGRRWSWRAERQRDRDLQAESVIKLPLQRVF